MRRLFTNVLKGEDGQALVLVALMMVVLMGSAAMVVDVGMMQVAKTKLQNAADAAALAGAKDLPNAGTAMNTAKVFAELNGAEKTGTIAKSPYDGSSNKIEVICTKNVPHLFAGVLGFTDANISARAVAEKSSAGGPFNYTVFSGDPRFTLTFNGSGIDIGGNAHSNYAFVINGSSHHIIGSTEAVTDFVANGSNITISKTCQASTIRTTGSAIYIGNKVYTPSPFIDMPDFSAQIQSEAKAAGQEYAGDRTYNGSSINVDAPIYIKGNLIVNGSNFTGKGVVLVSGNIIFNGSNLSSSGSAVCFYSKNGDITVNGSGIRLDGLVYAPKGSIIMNGSNQTVKGRVIGNNVVFNGSGYDIAAGSEDLESLPQKGTRLLE